MGKANSQTNPKSTNNKFWQFRNLADDDQKAELLLYGDISERSWWEDAATPKRFADDLAALGDVKEITVYINSGGGDVFRGPGHWKYAGTQCRHRDCPH